MSDVQRSIIVIGAGAAGLMAAGRAAQAAAAAGVHARASARIIVLEKMDQPARKLRISGKGRCNLTNVAPLPEFIEHFGRTGKFLHHAFSRFFSAELIALLESLGLELTTERGGRVFPACAGAPEVVRTLVQWVKSLGVEIRLGAAVEALAIEDGCVRGIVAQGRELPCEAVIVATGGASYPATGSSGDGYRLAEAAGHTIVPVRPALVPLETAGPAAAAAAGLTLRNVRVQLLVGGKRRREGFGELAFTESGIAGPLTLTLSGDAVDALRRGEPCEVSIDLKPALDDNKLDARLRQDFAARGREAMPTLLRGLLPPELVAVCLEQTGIPAGALGNQVTAAQRARLRRWLKDFRLAITGHRPLREAIVTAGGVATREVEPRTMESRLVPGLYFAGEVLDLQADTGGYNLQCAFSTGWLAGMSAAEAQAPAAPET